MDEITQALKNYDIGKILEVDSVNKGTVNRNFLITTSTGKYLLQNTNSIYNEMIAVRYLELTKLFENTSIKLPKAVVSNNGEYILTIEGQLWRLFEYIENDDLTSVYTTNITEDHAYKAGVSLAEIHKTFNRNNYSPNYYRPDFNNVKLIIPKIDRLIEENSNYSEFEKIKVLYDKIKVGFEKHWKPEFETVSTVHGDPAIRNFLFKGEDIVGIVDWDDTMPMNQLRELGEALQSWALEKPSSCHLELFEAGLKGYQSNSETILDRNLVIDAAAIYILLISARYLSYIFEPTYMLLDKSKYANEFEQFYDKCKIRLEYYDNFIEIAKQFYKVI